MVQLWMSWCRLCAREDPSNSHINVLLKNEEGLPITDTITQYFSIDVRSPPINNFNNLPNMICADCYHHIRTTINLNHRVGKVSAMFAELQITNEEEIDAHTIKARHNLECDFRVFADSALENTIEYETRGNLSEIDEQMIDKELMNPISIKTEEDERDNYDRLASHSEESSSGSAAGKTNQKDAQKTKKKYQSRKERRSENSTKPHYCSECQKGFLKLHNYRRHMLDSHGITIELKPPLFICENCGKEYKSISALKEHEHSHTEERTLKCKFCEKTFKGIPSLRLHEDTHNETNYICVVCGLKLNTQRTLRMHMVVHSDQRKHKCDHCGNEFKRAKALKNHLILHTGLKPYSCDFCDRTFASGANCRSHKKKNHPVALAAQEAAGKKNTLKTKIPRLRELKAVTAKISKPNNHDEEFIEDASLGSISAHNTSITFKSEVVGPNDLHKALESSECLVSYEKTSSKEESEFYQGIF